MSAHLQLDWLEASVAARKRGTKNLLADLPRSRAADPDTSHQAADKVRRSGELGKQQLAVLEAVKRWPGRTSAELGQLIAQQRQEDVTRWRYTAARRLPELTPVHIRRAKPRKCEATGNPATTWYPVGGDA